MNERRRIVLAVPAAEEDQLHELLYSASASVLVVGSATDADELLARVGEFVCDGVLVSPAFPRLTGGHCARLRARGLQLVGIALTAEREQALHELGLATSVSVDSDPGELGEAFADAGSEVPEPVASRRRRATARAREGSVVVVVGAHGSPGATELAVSLAALCGRRFASCLLELDGKGGLDLRLGADALAGSLLAAARAVQAGERESERLVERWLSGGEQGWPPVLLSPPEPRSLEEIAKPGTLNRVLELLGSRYPLTVCDLGASLAETSADTVRLPAREALVGADAVVLTLGTRAGQFRAGIAMLNVLLSELAVSPERLRVVVNAQGAPGSLPSAELRRAAETQLAALELSVDAWLPYDQRALNRATRLGLPLVLARPRGGYARALQALVGELFVASSARPLARKARLRLPALGISGLEEVALPWRR